VKSPNVQDAPLLPVQNGLRLLLQKDEKEDGDGAERKHPVQETDPAQQEV